MPRTIRAGLIQASVDGQALQDLGRLKQYMIDKHVSLIEQAAAQQVQVLCLQELFYGPYFPAEQDVRWYAMVEKVPEGPTVRLMQELAKKHGMVLIVPVYEEEMPGVYYNTAAVLERDGTYLGKYRKTHIPHLEPGFWEKFYFKPGNTGYPVFDTSVCKVGVYICYDRHFPEGARALGLNGAELVFNPSATVAGLSEYLWELEQPAHAIANGYFVGAINRVGWEQPWEIGEFYGKSYFCDPRVKSSPKGPVTGMKSSSPTWTWMKYAKSAPLGSFTGTAAPTPMTSCWSHRISPYPESLNRDQGETRIGVG